MSRMPAAVFLFLALSAATLLALSPDPRLTVADVERVTGLKGIQLVAPGSVTGAGAGLNFASADKHMVLMVNFGTAALYRRAKEQKTIGGLPMPLHAAAHDHAVASQRRRECRAEHARLLRAGFA